MLQHDQLIQRAEAKGVKVTDLTRLMKRPTALLEFEENSELVMEGVPTSWINARSQFYCDNKQLTKLVYEKLEIPHPASILFEQGDEPELNALLDREKNYVAKPVDGTNGEGVITGIQTLSQVKKYLKDFSYLQGPFMLEEQVEGEDLRIQVMGGKIVAACIREPAFVIGNGQDRLEDLVMQRREIMLSQNPGNRLDLDEASQQLLAQQGISLEEIPVSGHKIQLKYVSNMAQGGMAIDVTQEIHPAYYGWVEALSEYLESNYFGLDIMTHDYALDPMNQAWVLEINARAEWLHHTFSERRTHDMAGMMLNRIFGI